MIRSGSLISYRAVNLSDVRAVLLLAGPSISEYPFYISLTNELRVINDSGPVRQLYRKAITRIIIFAAIT